MRAEARQPNVSMATQSKWQSLPTEQINPASLAIDKTAVRDIIDMMVNEDRKVVAAVHKEREKIAHGIEIIAQAFRKGGRIVFVGAGTSGRLGVVEAAEIPPTFGTPPRLVQALMAGGQSAVFQAKEGVEDNYEEGGRSIGRLRLSNRDVVIGVSASGITPFVRGALTRARKAGAKIIFVTCWPGSELQNFVDLIIAPAVGPEIIAGSTRLKAGTATKMVLNMLTSISMIKVGKTYGNLMVDVQTGSEKLKDRARRILGVVTGLEYEQADALLKRARWNVKAAIVMEKTGLSRPQALKRLRKADDSIRDAIGEDIEPRLRQLLGSR
jgi:N-acetylmuramic acid 6-phosphate etherase